MMDFIKKGGMELQADFSEACRKYLAARATAVRLLQQPNREAPILDAAVDLAKVSYGSLIAVWGNFVETGPTAVVPVVMKWQAERRMRRQSFLLTR
jgi:hypothetical protein